VDCKVQEGIAVDGSAFHAGPGSKEGVVESSGTKRVNQSDAYGKRRFLIDLCYSRSRSGVQRVVA
jgi:hypothetical protein